MDTEEYYLFEEHGIEPQDIEDVKDFLAGLVEAVYETGDIGSIEGCLEELCHFFDVPFSDKTPKIQTRSSFLMIQTFTSLQKNLYGVKK